MYPGAPQQIQIANRAFLPSRAPHIPSPGTCGRGTRLGIAPPTFFDPAVGRFSIQPNAPRSARTSVLFGPFFDKGLRADAKTHRVSYFLTHGHLPPAPLVIRHTCDNPPCCNPAHLVPGTYQDNARDCVERGRHPTKGKILRAVAA